MQPPQIAAPPTIAGPGPVRCDGSSSDDDEQGIVKVKFGAEDQGPLGIEFKEVSIKSCNPGGMGQFRAGRPLEAGMILRAINGVPADRLAFNAVLELVGHHGGDIRGLTLTFQRSEHVNMAGFNDKSPTQDSRHVEEMKGEIEELRKEIDSQAEEIASLKEERDEQEATVIEALAPLLPRGVAKHDYPANPDDAEEGDLRFSSGNKIVLLDLADEEWARGYVEGQPELVGDFPRAFINTPHMPEGVGSVAASETDDVMQLREENEKLQAMVDEVKGGGSLEDGVEKKYQKMKKEVVELKKKLKAAASGDVAEALGASEAEQKKDKRNLAKLKKRVLKDQKMLKRQHEEKEYLIQEMRNWKRELQMVLSDVAHMEAMANRLQDEFEVTIPRAEGMICDKIHESLDGLHEEVDALAEERCADIRAEMEEEIHMWKEKHDKECVERRKWFNVVQELKGNIRVICRCRPLLPFEEERGTRDIARFATEGEIVVGDAPRAADNKMYEFDSVFGPDADQEDVFADTKQLVQSAMDGYNVCVFAYGQTGSGKTFTMEGDLETNPGINLRALIELFRLRDERDGEYQVALSNMEIYCDQVRDLLAPPARAGQAMDLKSVGDGAYVPGLTTVEVHSPADVVDALSKAKENRSVTATKMNSESSRSHSVVCIEINGESPTLGRIRGKLNLVDLAGSERISKSGASGQALKEAAAINTSLTALGNVINGLGKTKGKKGRGHIPYRDSKLTYLLADSLGGDAKVMMFVNVSPAEDNCDETNNSLTFATRCRATELGEAKKNH